ncbi:MAG: penicillin-binding protein 2 [Phycisphaerae bacterium]|jgi:cell division protein FtsI/penicillin-binding protein 2
MRSLWPLTVAVTLLLTAGAARLAQLELRDGAALRAQAQRQQVASWTIPSQRGEILDCQGRVLAGSVRRPSVFVDPAMVEDVRYAAASVAPVLGMSARALEEQIRAEPDRRFMWLCREIEDQQLEAFEQVRRARGLLGFGVQHEPQRVYPYARLAAQVLGFVGSDQHGLAGVELSFDSVLHGKDGRGRSTVDTRRRRVRTHVSEFERPVDGATVVLAIDAYLQQRTELHLREAVEQFKAEWGAAVLMDPHSGEVLAMATFPDFDPANPVPPNLSEAEQARAAELLRNRAIADSVEPGSIFKPYIASCALDEGQTRLDETFRIAGPTRNFGRRTIRDTHPYDVLALHEVISKSSNIGMGMLAARLGNERLHRYVRLFGFGDVTGIELPGEHAGLVQDFSRWTGYSTQSIPIGQEIALTPIQIVSGFAVFANGGVLYRPRLVRGVIGADGRAIRDESRPIPLRRVLSEETTRRFRMEALVETVLSGTGKQAAIPDYQVFGKTGTAQVARRDGRGYIPGAYVGSFVGGAPADNPRAVVVVSLYRPSGGKYYGGTVAAPAAGAILADTLTYMRVPPDPHVPGPENG